MKKNLFLFFAVASLIGISNSSFAQTAPATVTPVDQNSFADAFAPISTRILSDPLFLPLKGQIYGLTDYTFGRPTYDRYNYVGTEKSTIKGNDNTFGQTLEYGITDDLTVRLLESYEFNKTDTRTLSSGKTTADNDRGFTNPTIGASYRVLDQISQPVDVDLTLNYAPDAFDNLNGNDGTVASGRPVVTFGGAIGREMNMFTVAATAGASYLGTEDYETASGDNHNVDQSVDYTLGLDTQTRLTDRFSINLDALYTLNTHEQDTDKTTGTTFTDVPANSWAYTAQFNYQVIPNKLVVGLTYTYDLFSNGKGIYATTSSDTITENHDSNIYGARILYLF